MNISRDELASIFHNVFPFSDLNSDHFNLLLNNSEVIFFPAEKMVYIEGAPAEYLYIVFKGQVEVLKEKARLLDQLNILGDHFAFGEDVLLNIKTRQTSARAITDVILIKINFERISQISAEDGEFNKNLKIMVSTYEHLVSKTLIRGADETIFYIGQPHKITLIIKSILTTTAFLGIGILLIILFNNRLISFHNLLLGAGLLAGVCVVWLGWHYLEWSNDLFIFSNKRVINQQQALFSFETKQETPIEAIKSIQARKGFFARALEFGDLDIRTFTGSIRLPFVPDIIFVEQIITYLIVRLKDFQGEEEKQAFEQEIRERIIMKVPGQQIEFSTDQNRALVGSFDSEVPTEEADGFDAQNDIVYHMHWTILFSKVFIPITLFSAHILLYLFLVINKFAIVNNPVFNIIMAINCIAFIGWSIYRFADWKNDVFIISQDQLIDYNRRPFGMEEKQTAPIKNIQSIRYKRNGILGLLFNFGTVFILVGDEEFTFDNVHRPAEIQETLFAAKDRFHQKEEEAEKKSQRKKAVDWIFSYHQVIKDIREDGQMDGKNSDRP